MLALLPEEPETFVFQCLFGAACGLAALVMRLPLEAVLGRSFPFILIFPALTLSAVRAGPIGGLITAAIFGFFVLTLHGAGLSLPSVTVSMLLFVISASVVIVIAHGLRTTVSSLRTQEITMKDSDARLRLLVMELQHRVNNSLALTGALVNLTARHCTDLPQFRDRFQARLHALARAQALLTHTGWEPVDLHQLAMEALSPFLDDIAPAIMIHPGADFVAPVHAAVTLSLVLTELATNAVKHGALSCADGRVMLGWTVDATASTVHLAWRERGGPAVTPTGHRGFGTELFSVVSRDTLTIERHFEPDGVVCDIWLRPGG